MAKQITTTVYTFDELSDKAKDKARDWYRDGALDYEWWDSTYEDAENVGLKLEYFGLDRNRHATGKFVEDALSCAHKVMEEHGVECETYRTAELFLKKRGSIVDGWPKDEDGEFENQGDLDEALDTCEAEYLKSILEDYSIILQKEYEYLMSDEAVDEAILANEYTFTETGKREG